MTIYDQPREPGAVVDHLLWRGAQLMLSRHRLAEGGDCPWCGLPSPCPARDLAERALAVAYQPVRSDLTVSI